MPSLIDRYEGFAIDLDGVVWLSRDLIDGAAEGIRALRDADKKFLLLTNNATYPPEVVTETLGSAGVEVDPEQVLNSAMVLRDWISERGLTGVPAYILGEPAVIEQLADVVEVVEATKPSSVGLVVVARDVDFSFERLRLVSDAIRSGATLVAMNRDTVLPTANGFEPGTGAVLAAIEIASGAVSEVVGKPELPMMKSAARLLGTERVLMVGDRCDSDVAGAKRIGWDSAIVLTGVTRRGDVYDPVPNYVLNTLAELSSDLSRIETPTP